MQAISKAWRGGASTPACSSGGLGAGRAALWGPTPKVPWPRGTTLNSRNLCYSFAHPHTPQRDERQRQRRAATTTAHTTLRAIGLRCKSGSVPQMREQAAAPEARAGMRPRCKGSSAPRMREQARAQDARAGVCPRFVSGSVPQMREQALPKMQWQACAPDARAGLRPRCKRELQLQLMHKLRRRQEQQGVQGVP
jgi:hypothetical protein